MTKESLKIEAEGNTRSPQPKQLIHWCFTFNNYNLNDIKKLEMCFKRICEKYVFQEETGEEGTQHLQGYIHLKKRMRWSEFKLSPKIHWEACRSPSHSIDYCQKEDTRTGNVYKFGLEDIRCLSEEQLYPWQREVLDIILTEPDDRKVYWIYNWVGNVGKSAFVKFLFLKYNVQFCCGGKSNDLINLVFNTNMCRCSCLIWDLPRENKGKVSWSTIECVKNGLVANTKYETGTKAFNPPHIFIFSNYEPESEDHLSSDRWDIRRIEDVSAGGAPLLALVKRE